MKEKKQLDPYSPGGCFIATACYSSEFTDQVISLKSFRDSVLSDFSVGRKFIELYYKYSPPVADFLENNEACKLLVRLFVVEPSYIVSKLVMKLREN